VPKKKRDVDRQAPQFLAERLRGGGRDGGRDNLKPSPGVAG